MDRRFATYHPPLGSFLGPRAGRNPELDPDFETDEQKDIYGRLEAEAVDEDRRCGCGRLLRFDADWCDVCTDQDTRTFGEPA